MSRLIGKTKRHFFLVSGFVSLALGFIGIFLPLLPTTPFLLLAAFCFSRGSDYWHQWLLTHPRWGRLILDWQNHGVIRLRAKVMSTGLIFASWISTLLFAGVPLAGRVGVSVTLSCALIYIWTRPSHPRDPSPPK